MYRDLNCRFITTLFWFVLAYHVRLPIGMNDRALISWVFPTARLWCLDTPHRCQYSTGHCYNLHCSHSLSARQKSGKNCLVVLHLISNVLNPSENVSFSDNMINILFGSWWSMSIIRVFVWSFNYRFWMSDTYFTVAPKTHKAQELGIVSFQTSNSTLFNIVLKTCITPFLETLSSRLLYFKGRQAFGTDGHN